MSFIEAEKIFENDYLFICWYSSCLPIVQRAAFPENFWCFDYIPT